MPLALDAVVEDVLSTLANPEEYVRGIVSIMSQLRSEHGDVVVRIGTTGQGFSPTTAWITRENRASQSRPSTGRTTSPSPLDSKTLKIEAAAA